MAKKVKLACYWAASCGGCEIAVLEIAEKILELIKFAEFVFWPCVMDFKYEDVKNYKDGFIDVCLFNGGIRNSESEEIAHLLRKKSKVLVAYGSCSHMGGIPSLANLYKKEDLLDRVYKTTETTENPDNIFPQEKTNMPEGELSLPKFYDRVKRLSDVVDVDYFMPGCPPTAKNTWEVLELIKKNKLPAKGSIIGAGNKTVCDECPFEKKTKDVKIKAFKRPHLDKPDLEPKKELNGKAQCLLEQGFICMGSATRSGCGAQCLNANLGCRGCYGPANDVIDQGAKIASAIGSLIDTESDSQKTDKIVKDLVDPIGNFYRFGMANGIIKGKMK